MPEKTIAEKLRVKPGTTVAVVGAPAGFVPTLGLPEDVTLAEGMTASADVTLTFVDSLPKLAEELDALAILEAPAAVVWVAYPKGRPKEEINRDSIFSAVNEHGAWQTVSQVALDDTWSALRLKRVG